MQIAILLPDLRGGGAERVGLDLAREFASFGHRVELLAMQAKGELLDEATALCRVTDLQIKRARNLPFALARHLKDSKPDVVLAAMWPLTAIAPIAARLSGHRSKVVVSEHGMLSLQYSDWGGIHRFALAVSTAIGYRLADYRVGVSCGVARDMAHLSAMPVTAFKVIHNPISNYLAPSVQAVEAAAKQWGGQTGVRILSVGSLKAVKNQALLIRAVAMLEGSEARLLLLGEGKEKAALAELAEQLGVDDRVVLAGFQPDPTPFYAAADLFVLSSNAEGFGNVIVEAMGQGTPVISTDCPTGPREILDQGKYGRLTPVNDDVALAKAIMQTLCHPDDPSLLKGRAANFLPEKAAQAYLSLFRQP